MNLEFEEILDRGDAELERVILRANADLDLGDYALFCAYENEKGITNYLAGAYWFADGPVQAGDVIIVHSGKGKDTWGQPVGDTRTHEFFWGRSSTLWESTKWVPVLLLVSEWEPFRPKETSGAAPTRKSRTSD